MWYLSLIVYIRLLDGYFIWELSKKVSEIRRIRDMENDICMSEAWWY